MPPIPEPLWHDEEDLSSSHSSLFADDDHKPLWSSSTRNSFGSTASKRTSLDSEGVNAFNPLSHPESSECSFTDRDEEDSLLMVRLSAVTHENENCMFDQEIAAMMAAELNQKPVHAKPPPTSKDKLMGIMCGFVILVILIVCSIYAINDDNLFGGRKSGSSSHYICPTVLDDIKILSNGSHSMDGDTAASSLCAMSQPNCTCSNPMMPADDYYMAQFASTTLRVDSNSTLYEDENLDVVFLGTPFDGMNEILDQVNGLSIGLESERVSIYLLVSISGLISIWLLCFRFSPFLPTSCLFRTTGRFQHFSTGLRT